MEKLEIIKTYKWEDTYIIIAKEKKQEYHKCKECKHFKYFDGIGCHYCDKYKEVVFPEDFCIEDGM